MTERRLFFWSIPLGLDLTAKEERLPPFSQKQSVCMCNNRPCPPKWATPIPHHYIDTCEQSVWEVPSSLDLAPPNPSAHMQKSLPLGANPPNHYQYNHPMDVPVSVPAKQPKIFCYIEQLELHLILILSKDCVPNAYLLRCPHVFDSFTLLVCPWKPSLIICI